LAVTPPVSAGGNQYSVSYSHGQVVRWNPCSTITYAVNDRLAGTTPRARAAALRDARGAMARAAAATGMTFSFVGTTSEVPKNTASQTWSKRQRAADIVIAWVTPRTSNLLDRVGRGYAAGTGGWVWKSWRTSAGAYRVAIGRGFAVLNSEQRHDFRPGFGSGVTRGALLLHEIGHALGLNHVSNTHEIMYPVMLKRQSSGYKAGDRLGLARLGRAQGCMKVSRSVWMPLPSR